MQIKKKVVYLTTDNKNKKLEIMKATLDNITIGVNIKMGNIVMCVTNINNRDILGFQVYKGKQRFISISKKNFSNPHYMNSYQLV